MDAAIPISFPNIGLQYCSTTFIKETYPDRFHPRMASAATAMEPYKLLYTASCSPKYESSGMSARPTPDHPPMPAVFTTTSTRACALVDLSAARAVLMLLR